MFERFSRSLDLVGASWEVLKADKSLLAFPVFSTMALCLVIASFVLPVVATGHARDVLARLVQDPSPMTYGAAFAFYFVCYTVMNFFNTALVGVALAHFDGDSISASDGLRIAVENLPTILVYSAVSATIGTVLRMLEERMAIIGQIVVGLIGVTWSCMTYMVVPVLAAESVGPVEAVQRSARLLKKNWGESLIGNGGIELVMGLIALVLALAGFSMLILAARSGSSAGALGAVAFIAVSLTAVALVSTTLHAIYSAALYRYAIGARSGPFDDGVLSGAFGSR